MAYYKYPQSLEQEDTGEYDVVYEPGAVTRVSGIYRCDGCGKSVTSIRGKSLPQKNHHEHTLLQGRIRWRLVAKSFWAGEY